MASNAVGGTIPATIAGPTGTGEVVTPTITATATGTSGPGTGENFTRSQAVISETGNVSEDSQ